MCRKDAHPIVTFADNGEDFEAWGEQPASGGSLLSFYNHMSEKLGEVPWQDLEKKGWIDGERGVPSLAPFVSSFFAQTSDTALFRKADNANETKVFLWASRVETQAKLKYIDMPKHSFGNERLQQTDLVTLAKKSVDVKFITQLPEYLSHYGIVLVYEPALPGLKADGVVFKLDNGVPAIGLSLRYTRLDNFWFTLMHELSHIVLHYDDIKLPIIEDFETVSVDALEVAANRLAQNSFVPRSIWNRCEPRYELSEASIRKFAKQVEVHPAIIAGMLQREIKRYDRFRLIVDAVNVIDIIQGTV